MGALPVDAVLPEVVAALAAHPACVLVAPTGAGKTTRLPPALDDAGLGPVVVLEPRRIAARAAARRVAAERTVALGREVGYHVRFDRKTSADTRIAFVTDGIFVRRIQEDPFLDGVGCVVLDEFHERSLDVDLALAMVRRVQGEAREDLRLVVTSATLDADAVAAHLGGAPIVRSEGRLFPVAEEYLPARPSERPDGHVARGVRRALEETSGGLLVFLPGVGEIRRAHAALEGTARAGDLELLELYGDLAPEAQDAALAPGCRRKIVLATNVAESSVTVPGVTGVVDTGLARTLQHDAAVGLDRLTLGRISLASAEQRKGRAGREAPGICVRLWSAIDQRTLTPFDEPEIKRADLAGAVLQLLAWGERDLSAFPWYEPPRPDALARAFELLTRLGAAADGAPTELGHRLARLPVHPRLGCLLIEGERRGDLERAALAAAVLSDRDPWRRSAGREPTRRVSDSDVLDRVRALEAFARGGAGAAPELAPGGARACLAAARQLERTLRKGRGAGAADAADDALLRSLLAAFPDRLTRRRRDDPRRGVMVGGRGVRLAPQCAVTEPELFLSVELDAGRGEALVRQASAVEREWVDGGRTRTVIECVFDPARERVVGKKRVRLGELVIEESDVPANDAAEVERVLAAAARVDPERALDLGRDDVQTLFARITCLREWMPELELPAFEATELAALAGDLALGCRSFADLRKAPLAAAVKARLDRRQLAALDREAPERIAVPSGSKIRIAYESGRPPVLAARIQELFGMAATPRVAAGRVPVLLHLLAPNGRPQQVTEDLASFWSGAYFEVRKELRRRYPKHAWPEDPTQAVARRRPGRRRR
ncbi:MAG: ATP-dependent helicase HrpB [bacterium]|nr:ATP-dependent helicase HrpB [bacterium]